MKIICNMNHCAYTVSFCNRCGCGMKLNADHYAVNCLTLCVIHKQTMPESPFNPINYHLPSLAHFKLKMEALYSSKALLYGQKTA